MKESGGWMQDLTSIFSYLWIDIRNIKMYNCIDKLRIKDEKRSKLWKN